MDRKGIESEGGWEEWDFRISWDFDFMVRVLSGGNRKLYGVFGYVR